MLKSYVEAVCWMSRHSGAVLVVSIDRARLVDQQSKYCEGLSLSAARALTNNPRRARWFTTEPDGERSRMRLNAEGETYHRQLVAGRKCPCRPSGREASAGEEKHS